jgi:hypothetical protein
LKLRAVLRRVVETMSVLIVPRGSWKLCAVQVHFVGGAVRHYLVLHQTAANGREGGWRVHTFAEADVGTRLNLRNPSHVHRLEKVLAELNPSDLGA